MLEIADYCNSTHQKEIAFNYYNKYLGKKYPQLYSKFFQTFPPGFYVNDDRENQCKEVLRLIDTNMILVHLAIFAIQKGYLNIVLIISKNFDVIKTQIDTYLKLNPNQQVNLQEIYNDYFLLSDKLSNVKHHNDINKLAIKFNPNNKAAYLNIIDDYIYYDNNDLALDFYNTQFKPQFGSDYKANILDLCNYLVCIYREHGDYYKSVFYQKKALEIELGELLNKLILQVSGLTDTNIMKQHLF